MDIVLSSHPHPRELVPLRDRLLAALAEGAPLLRAEAVAHLPLSFVQLLMAASRAAAARGTVLRVVNPSFAFLFAFEALGVDPGEGPFQLEYGA